MLTKGIYLDCGRFELGCTGILVPDLSWLVSVVSAKWYPCTNSPGGTLRREAQPLGDVELDANDI